MKPVSIMPCSMSALISSEEKSASGISFVSALISIWNVKSTGFLGLAWPGMNFATSY